VRANPLPLSLLFGFLKPYCVSNPKYTKWKGIDFSFEMSTLLALLFSRRRAPAREREEESKRTTTRGEIPRRRRRRQRGETFGARAFVPPYRERELVRGDPRNRSSLEEEEEDQYYY